MIYGTETPLQVARRKAACLSLACGEFPALREAMLPYPSNDTIDMVAKTFRVKTKVKSRHVWACSGCAPSQLG